MEDSSERAIDEVLLSVVRHRSGIGTSGVFAPGYRKGEDTNPSIPTYDWRAKRWSEANSRGIQPQATVRRLREAMDREYDSPAHMLLYTMFDTDGLPVDPHPRVNQNALPWLRSQGYDLRFQLLVADYDNPKVGGAKQPWTLPGLDEFFAAFATLPTDTTGYYLTAHGAHLFQVLSRPITEVEYEHVSWAWLERLIASGIAIDTTCTDWTRLFLMPSVMREHKQTGKLYRSHSEVYMPLIPVLPPSLKYVDTIPGSELVPAKPRPKRTRLSTTAFAEALPDAWDHFATEVGKALAVVNPVGQYHDTALALAGTLCQLRRISRPLIPEIVRRILACATTIARIPDDARHRQAATDTVAKYEQGETIIGKRWLLESFPDIANAVFRLAADGALARAFVEPPTTVPAETLESLAEARGRTYVFLRALEPGLNALASPPGVGKSEACRELEYDRVDVFLRVLASREPGVAPRPVAHTRMSVLCPTHELAIEYANKCIAATRAMVARMRREDPASVIPADLQLVARHFSPASMRVDPKDPKSEHVCKFPGQAHALMSAGLSMKRELCDGRKKSPCPHRDGCPAYEGMDGDENAPIQIGVHPHAAKLAKKAGDTGIVVIDEPPSLAKTATFVAEELKSALAFDRLGDRYALALRPFLSAMLGFLDHAPPLESHTLERALAAGVCCVTAHELFNAVEATHLDIVESEDPVGVILATGRAAHSEDDVSKAPSFKSTDIILARGNLDFAEELARVGRVYNECYETLMSEPQPVAGNGPRLWVDTADNVRRLVIKRLDEPLVQVLNGECVLVLDGNLEVHEPILARAISGKPNTLRIVVPDGATVSRTRIVTPCNRGAWFNGKAPRWDGPVGPALRRALAWLAEDRETRRVGLVTFLPVEIALRGLLDPGGRQAWIKRGGTVASWNEIDASLGAVRDAGCTWELGHYGAIRGVNRFEKADLDAFITLGDPRPNLGDVQRDCEFHDVELDWEERTTVICQAELEQAQERIRTATLKRPVRVCHVGEELPGGFGWSTDIVRVLT